MSGRYDSEREVRPKAVFCLRLWFLKGSVCKTSERTANVVVVGGDGSLTLLNFYLFPFYGSSHFCRAEAADKQPISDKKDENRSGQALSP